MTTPLPQIEQHLRRKILWPLGIAIAGSLAIFLFVSSHYMEVGLSRSLEGRLQSLISRYHNFTFERTALMRTVLQQMNRDPVLLEALAAHDRQRLLQHSLPLYHELLAEQHITHFYFHTADGINLLRVHLPERSGDKIERLTLRMAQTSDELADGLELGPLGTFTLRVVQPVHLRGERIGFFELGEDIDPVLDHLASEFDVKMTVLIEKRFLDQSSWITGRRMLGEAENWDLLPDYVVGGASDPEIASLLPRLATGDALRQPVTVETTIGGRTFRGRFLNLMDAGGRQVGALLVLQDIDDILKDHRTATLLISLFCLLLGLFLFWIAAAILGRADRNLQRIGEQLSGASPVSSSSRPISSHSESHD